MKHDDIKMDKKTVKKAVGMHDKQQHGGKKTDLAKLKKGGAMHKMPDGSMMAGKSHGMKHGGMTKMNMGGMAKGYAAGGMPMVEKDGKKVPAFAADGKGKMAHGGKVTKMACGGRAKKYAEGGTVKPAPEKKETMTSDMKDKMQDMKNEKAFQNYQKTKKLAKGGGIEVRGKTRGKMC